jgi:FlaA1/EpsC-like NDP-sugar epimerase
MTKFFLTLAHSRRTLVLVMIYAAIIGASFYLSYEVRFDFSVSASSQAERLRLVGWVVGIKLVALVLVRQLDSVLTYFSIPDLLRLVWGMAGASAVILIPRVLSVSDLSPPRGVVLTDFLLCLGGLCLARLSTRLYRERITMGRGVVSAPQQRIIIIGAGDAGASLAKEFINAPSRGFKPVMFFDDDTAKHGKLVHGVRVIGAPERIATAEDIGDVAKAVIAMPMASAKRIREVVLLLTAQGIKVETLPSIEELTSGRVRVSRIRPVEVQDLLGRDAVDLDSVGIRKLVEGRVILVTGAGGSIGGELCRQIAALNPRRLLMVEQAEGSLFNIEQELNDLGLGAIALPLIGDVLDRERMEFIFARHRPHVVFHAAAHKHVYLMERQPAEAIRNNVLGTRLLARVAAAQGVEAFVFISTDKAINPTSVMGATKRLAEIQLMAIAAGQGTVTDGGGRTTDEGRRTTTEGGPTENTGHAEGFLTGGNGENGGRMADGRRTTEGGGEEALKALNAPLTPPARTRTKFMAVRFGNVLGSSGSVIPIFKRQIANGGPVTVTHPDVTRYFMTIPEAVGLVLQSSVLGKGGEIFVLDMAQPVKIVDLARQMIELSGFKVGEDIEITFTGLKPGEKLFEELRHSSETHVPTEHPRIMRFTTMAQYSESGVDELEQKLYLLETNELKRIIHRLVPEYTPFLD